MDYRLIIDGDFPKAATPACSVGKYAYLVWIFQIIVTGRLSTFEVCLPMCL